MAKLGTAKKMAADDLHVVISPETAAANDVASTANTGAQIEEASHEEDGINPASGDILPLLETDSRISSASDDSQGPWLEIDPEIADLEEELAEVAGEVRTLLAEMDEEQDSSRQSKERFEIQMASAAAKLAPMYVKIKRMPEDKRRAFLLKPATANGVEKKWPDRRAVDADAVMMVHKYLFDHHKVRKGNVIALCNRIGYTAAVLGKNNITEYEEAYQYIIDNGKPSKISLRFTAGMKNKYEIGLSYLDSMEVKCKVTIPDDNLCDIGSYRALLFRKIEATDEGVVYGYIVDLAPGEEGMRQIIERYHSSSERAESKNGDASEDLETGEGCQSPDRSPVETC